MRLPDPVGLPLAAAAAAVAAAALLAAAVVAAAVAVLAAAGRDAAHLSCTPRACVWWRAWLLRFSSTDQGIWRA